MIRKRHFANKFIAVFVSVAFLAPSVTAYALEEEVLLEEDSTRDDSEEVLGLARDKEADEELLEDAAGTADSEDLRDSIDIDELIEQIDEDELLEQIDEDELRRELELQEQKFDDSEVEISQGVVDLNDKEEVPENVTWIENPVLENEKLFDFAIDPMKILYSVVNDPNEGGRKVQESASVLFRNYKGPYYFSGRSDVLSYVNKGNVPVRVVVDVTIDNISKMKMASDKEFEGTEPELYLALVDSRGNEVPIDENGKAQITEILYGAEMRNPVFAWNSETSSYEITERKYRGPEKQEDPEEQPEESKDRPEESGEDVSGNSASESGDDSENHNEEDELLPEEDELLSEEDEDSGEIVDEFELDPLLDPAGDVYSFALVGACNIDGDWHLVTDKPSIVITWHTEPLEGQEPEDTEELSEDEDAFSEDVDYAEEEKELQQDEELIIPEESEEAAEEDSATEDTKEDSEAGAETDTDKDKDKEKDADSGEPVFPGAEASDKEEGDSADNNLRPTLEEAKLEELRKNKLEELKAEKLEELIQEKLDESENNF